LCEKFEDIKMVAGSRKMKGRWYNGKRKKRNNGPQNTTQSHV